jgi:hypothetical protein
MIWKKLGLIFCPEKNYSWMLTHAANPVAESLDNGLIRVYFSSRDANHRSSIGQLEFNPENKKIVSLSSTPVLGPGEIGTFSDSGSSMGCIVKTSDATFLYYLGWNLGVTVPWRNSIGLAVCPKEKAEFELFSKAPVLDRSSVDPFSVSYPWVLKEGSLWRMWYGSNLQWGANQNDMAHLIKYAESSDGIHWTPKNIISINFKSQDEYAISKPCIIKDGDIYRAWYSYRGKGYRIGYAESQNGITFERKDDQTGITVSDTGWDSETVEYPYVLDHKDNRYMFYNGNRYGLTGFGLAILEKN